MGKLLSLSSRSPSSSSSTLSSLSPLLSPLSPSPSLSFSNDFSRYSQSKYVSECLVRQASQRANLPVLVFRLGDISGDSRSGSPNLEHDIVRFIQAVVQMKSAPVANKWMDITPVDYAT